jgi:hypothetical protein
MGYRLYSETAAFEHGKKMLKTPEERKQRTETERRNRGVANRTVLEAARDALEPEASSAFHTYLAMLATDHIPAATWKDLVDNAAKFARDFAEEQRNRKP